MNLSLPVMAFGVSYNKTTTENKAYYFSTASELTHQISRLTLEQLKAKAQIMKSIAERRYTWNFIALRYDALIKEATGIKANRSLEGRLSKGFQETDLITYQAAHLKHQYLFFEERK